MFLRIYFGEKPLFLCDAIEPAIEPFLHHDDAVFIDELDAHSVKAMIHEMQQDHVHAGVFLHPDLEELKTAFFRKFTIVAAGGGLVCNEKEELLLIFRRGKWDLPKGKLDPGETIAACALREVREETGLKKVEITSPLGITYHTYHEGTHFILKESHWYRMQAAAGQPLHPQTEEDIAELRWITKTDLPGYFTKTYASITEVLQLFLHTPGTQ